MKDIQHINPTSLADAATTLQAGGAAVIAGGTDILGELKGMISPNSAGTLVNLKAIAGLDYIKEESGKLKIGALTALADIAASSVVQTKYAALAQAAHAVGTPELRNMGTIGGNICQKVRCWYYRGERNAFPCLRKNSSGVCFALTGDSRYHSVFGALAGCVAVNPSDVAPVLVAMAATIVTSKKSINAADFFTAKMAPSEATTVLDAGEIVTEIQVPTPATGVKTAFVKFAQRKAFDFPVVNCAAAIGAGNATIVLNAVYNTPKRVTAAEDSIRGNTITPASADAAGAAGIASATALPAIDYSPGNKYKIQIARTMIKRAILACA